MNKKVIIIAGLVIVIGGGIAFYIISTKKNATAKQADIQAASQAASQNAAITAQDKEGLSTRYANSPKEAAAIETADQDTLHKWALVTNLWNTGKDPYKYALDGVSNEPVYDNSIGKWWEKYSTQQGF
jgi:ABC-type enterochelin transport system substrate-binding protein